MVRASIGRVSRWYFWLLALAVGSGGDLHGATGHIPIKAASTLLSDQSFVQWLKMSMSEHNVPISFAIQINESSFFFFLFYQTFIVAIGKASFLSLGIGYNHV